MTEDFRLQDFSEQVVAIDTALTDAGAPRELNGPLDAIRRIRLLATRGGGMPELRRACAEMLLAGSLLLADVQRALGQWDTSHAAKQTEERFRKALEAGREALS